MKTVVVPCSDDSPLADGPWLVQPMEAGQGIHVLFEAEARLHELDVGCWCKPVVERIDPRTEQPLAEPLILHRHGIREAC